MPVTTPQFFKSYDVNGIFHSGSPESDKLLGYHGNDTLIGGPASDVLWGDWKPNNPKTQRDVLIGGPGGDFIYSSRGGGTLLGGSGDDFIKAREGRGTIDCGPGDDVVKQSRLRRKNWRIARNCEQISYTLDKHQNRK